MMDLIKTIGNKIKTLSEKAYYYLYKRTDIIKKWWNTLILLSTPSIRLPIKIINNNNKYYSTMITIIKTKYQWLRFELSKKADIWYKQMRKRMKTAGDNSLWWFLTRDWKSNIGDYLKAFRSGNYQFSPLTQYEFKDEKTEKIQVWSYLDRLILHLILHIIKPTFKHVISPLCLHLSGPTVIKHITQDIKTALNLGPYNYFLRIDIRSYYASIDRQLLLNQLLKHYNDPILRKYFEDIVTIAIDRGGQVMLPKKGIPIRSSLSPFFAALYLTSLDRAFENRKGVFYRRYNDDIIILVQNKRQYTKARKRLFAILRELKLRISPHKTRMGRLNKGFHFLGVDFGVSRNPQRQKQTQVATVSIHNRTCRRALDRVQALRTNTVHPANIQRYLIRWATWWFSMTKLDKNELIYNWVHFTEPIQPDSVWLGRGLLMGSDYYSLCLNTSVVSN